MEMTTTSNVFKSDPDQPLGRPRPGTDTPAIALDDQQQRLPAGLGMGDPPRDARANVDRLASLGLAATTTIPRDLNAPDALMAAELAKDQPAANADSTIGEFVRNTGPQS